MTPATLALLAYLPLATIIIIAALEIRQGQKEGHTLRSWVTAYPTKARIYFVLSMILYAVIATSPITAHTILPENFTPPGAYVDNLTIGNTTVKELLLPVTSSPQILHLEGYP